ncbi:MAG: GTPase Era [Alphaproteobacteria bacterium]|nr:GTPase Era [Alphaproteobacteria bacterium]
MTELNEQTCGYVTLLGVPNAGKSTLLNQLVGQKLSIVSAKPQTTRTRMLGIVMEGNAQIVFVDTPGIFNPKKPIEKAMVGAAWAGGEVADIILLIVDVTHRQPDSGTQEILAHIKRSHNDKPVWLVMNKVDAATNKGRLLPIVEALHKEHDFAQTFMISALDGEGVKDIVAKLATAMPKGPWLFDPEQVTDMSERLMSAEITREQLFLQLSQELPYSATVETDAWEQFDNGEAKVTQTIFVERDGQKAIVIGKGGEQLKAIGAAAREEMAKAFGFKVHLFLHVKVKEDWQQHKEFYESRGLTKVD